MGITREKIIGILKRFDIPYSTEGKNVSQGSVGIRCVFCDDQSDHLGIFEDTGLFSCWRCKKRGPFAYLLSVITGLPRSKCDEIVNEESESFREDSLDRINRIVNGGVGKDGKKKRKFDGLPEEFELVSYGTKFPLLHRYLGTRNIRIETIIKYGCGVCKTGRYMNRMIIPVVFGGKIVSFQAADLTLRADLKYDTAPGDINDYLYNYDSIKQGGRIIAVEGILDGWRVDDDYVVTFGTHFTNRQRSLILSKQPSELILAWDSDAYWFAVKESGWFEPFVGLVRVIKLPDGEDPDSMGKEEFFKLIGAP